MSILPISKQNNPIDSLPLQKPKKPAYARGSKEHLDKIASNPDLFKNFLKINIKDTEILERVSSDANANLVLWHKVQEKIQNPPKELTAPIQPRFAQQSQIHDLDTMTSIITAPTPTATEISIPTTPKMNMVDEQYKSWKDNIMGLKGRENALRILLYRFGGVDKVTTSNISKLTENENRFFHEPETQVILKTIQKKYKKSEKDFAEYQKQVENHFFILFQSQNNN